MNHQINTKIISITPVTGSVGAKLKDIRLDRPVKVKPVWLARTIKWCRQLYYKMNSV